MALPSTAKRCNLTPNVYRAPIVSPNSWQIANPFRVLSPLTQEWPNQVGNRNKTLVSIPRPGKTRVAPASHSFKLHANHSNLTTLVHCFDTFHSALGDCWTLCKQAELTGLGPRTWQPHSSHLSANSQREGGKGCAVYLRSQLASVPPPHLKQPPFSGSDFIIQLHLTFYQALASLGRSILS